MEGNAESLSDIREMREGRLRQRSSIKFPYMDLGEAISVAQAIHENAGTQCDRIQLAAYLGQSTTSGTFRLKVSTASNFGLVKSSHGVVALTSLGRNIADRTKSARAKVDAFFGIPLYQAIYDEFKGQTLPPPVALERYMASIGVSEKQTDKARQAFQRSAEVAGFFEHGKDRLVEPVLKATEDAVSDNSSSDDANLTNHPVDSGGAFDAVRRGDNGEGGSLPPLLQGLVDALPTPDGNWEPADRVNWLKLAVHIFNVSYKCENSAEIVISVKGEVD
ncbi:MAG: hypothetical protein LGR52_11815 [Candidatus Thiosymbion ectosymbiont of Robbea hypermnestra]|nr:hypothetical protein [Candidatus Thiosymbion ectosymbiont of Robbea hypermnestra]